MLKIEYHSRFKQDYKRAVKRGLDAKKLAHVISLLANGQVLPEKYRDHSLSPSREYQGVRECHIQPDWLLIYRIDHERLVLALVRTGSHSDLFS